MINIQRPAFPDLTNFCNKHLYMKLLSKFRAVQYLRHQKHKNRRTKLRKTTVDKFYPCWQINGLFRIHLLFSFGHMLTFIRYIQVWFTFAFQDCVCYNEDFIRSRFVIWRLCSIHFIVILAGLKQVVCYTQGFIIQRFVEGAVSRQSSSFCLILRITHPQSLWNLT